MAFYDTHWYVNFGDGSTTGYYAVAKRPQNTAVVAGQIVRQFTTPAVGSERCWVCLIAGTTANTTDANWAASLNRGGSNTDGTAGWWECTGQPAINGDTVNTKTWSELRAVTSNPSQGVIIKRNNGASYQYCVTHLGATGSSEPAFSDVAGTLTTDSGTSWRSLGPVGNFTGGQAPHARLNNALATNWFASGNTVYVGNNHAETQGTNITYSPTSALLAKILCHNRLGSYPPAASDITTGATVTTTGTSGIIFTWQGSFYLYGIVFSGGTTGGGAKISFEETAVGQVQNWFYFDSCSLQTASTTASLAISLGGFSTAWAIVTLNNTTVKFGATSHYMNIYFCHLVWQNTGQVLATGSPVPATLFQQVNTGGRFNTITLRNLDLSQLTGSLFSNANSSIGTLTVQDCKLNAAMTVTRPINSGMQVQLIRSDSATTAYKSTRITYEGTEDTETTIVRTDGAVDPNSQAQTRRIVTTANAQWLRPFMAEPYAIYNETVGSAVTVTVCGTVNAGALPNNDDVWAEFEYLGDAAVSGDPYWSDVKLLLGFEGADGSTTITDESSSVRGNATANSGAKIVTAQFKFGTSSYAPSGGYLSYSDSADWILAASNSAPYTVECWVRFNSLAVNKVIVAQYTGDGNFGWSLQTSGSSASEFVFLTSPVGSFATLVGPTSSGAGLTTGVWYHLAADKDATGKMRVYKDGVMVGSSTPANSAVFDSSINLGIGAASSGGGSFDGWMDELRVTKGTARYASDAGYTVPTARFPRVATTTVSPKGTIVTTTKASVLASNAAVASDSSVWITPLVPSSLTGLIGWWDMSNPANYTIGASSMVVSMVDLSGSGNTLGDGSATQKPVYSATGLNGLPTMLCDGNSTHIDIAVFPMGTGNTLTVFGVAIMTSGSWNSARLIAYSPVGFTDTGNASSWLLARNVATEQVYLGRNVTPSGFMTASYDVPHRFIGTINSSGVITLYIDGVASTTATSAASWATGGKLKVGQDSGNLAEWGGAISEIGVATGYSDAATVARLDAYLAAKWSLPAWTPFKLASTITPQLPGYIHARVRVGKVSATYYLDPKVTVAAVTMSAEVSAFLARTTGLDATHVNAYTALIDGLVADGVWAKLDVLYVFATQDATTAALNLVSSSYNGTVNGSPTFTADRGFTGVDSSSTVYINSQFNPSTASSPKYIQDSAHLSAWSLTNTHSLVNTAIGTYNGSTHNYLLLNYTDGKSYFRINGSSANSNDGASTADTRGFFAGSRTTSSGSQGYLNGTQIVNNGSMASAAVHNLNIYPLGQNNNGSALGIGIQEAMVSIGGGLTQTDVTNFYNRLRTYMTAVGVP